MKTQTKAKAYLLRGLISAALAGAGWLAALWGDSFLLFVGLALLIGCSVFSLFFFILSFLSRQREKKGAPPPSPFFVFGVVDGVLCVLVAAYAAYDIATDTGWFAGLLGTLLLIFVVPALAALLLADIIAAFVVKKRAAKVARAESAALPPEDAPVLSEAVPAPPGETQPAPPGETQPGSEEDIDRS